MRWIKEVCDREGDNGDKMLFVIFSPQEKSDEDKLKEAEIEKDKEVHYVCFVYLFCAACTRLCSRISLRFTITENYDLTMFGVCHIY